MPREIRKHFRARSGRNRVRKSTSIKKTGPEVGLGRVLSRNRKAKGETGLSLRVSVRCRLGEPPALVAGAPPPWEPGPPSLAAGAAAPRARQGAGLVVTSQFVLHSFLIVVFFHVRLFCLLQVFEILGHRSKGRAESRGPASVPGTGQPRGQEPVCRCRGHPRPIPRAAPGQNQSPAHSARGVSGRGSSGGQGLWGR